MHKKIFSSAGYLAGASLIEKLGGLIIVPILTASLLPSDYGALMLAISYVGLISLFFYNGLHSALFRWYSIWKESFDKRIYEKYLFLIISSIGLFLLLIIGMINYFIYDLQSFLKIDFQLFSLVYLSSLVLVGYNLKSSIWIIEQKPYYNLFFMTLKTVVSVGIVYFFIDHYVSSEIKPLADIIAIMLFSFIIYYNYFFKYPSFSSVSLKEISPVIRESFIYGWGLQISQISFWVINSSDRIMLAQLVDNHSVALYSILMLGTTVMFVVIAFNNSFSAYYNKMIHDGLAISDINKYINTYFILGFIAVLVYKFVLFYFAENIVLLLSTKEYLIIAPMLYLTSDFILFYFAYLLYSRYLHAHKFVKSIIYITIISALINIILNFLLIPLYGIIGALLGSIIAYFSMAAISLFILVQKIGLLESKKILFSFLMIIIVNLILDFQLYGGIQ